jgi:hypothetical protein
MLLVLIACYAISYLPLLLVQSYLQVDQFIIASLAWLLISLLSLPFFLRHLLKKIWFFQGNGEPVTANTLEDLLLEINDFDTPITVWKKRKKIFASWRYTEPLWSERMAINGVKKIYFLQLLFNQNTKTVSMVDGIKYANFDLCPIKVRTSLLTRPRFYPCVQVTAEDNLHIFKKMNAEEYKFTPDEIKTAIFNTIINNGWNVIFKLF